MNLSIIKRLLFLIIICIPVTLLSCSNTSKKITLSENTENEISLEESEIIKSITAGEKLLDEGKLEEAKENFSKAISLDKTNKDTYLRIKDKYISVNKLDEAYNIVKSAISNNVDIENMKLLLKEISSKFEVINLTSSIYQYSNYALPKNANITLLGNSVQIPITWDNEIVDAENLGTFKYEGFNEEYGRKVIMNITILENVYDKQIGWVKDFYKENGQLYINLDLVEFYLGREEALKEAIKDGKAGIDENGEYFLPAPVWIRNNSSAITSYPISDDCIYSLCSATINLENYETRGTLVNISYTDFLKAFNDTKNNNARILLVWVDIKNGSIFKIYEQYLP